MTTATMRERTYPETPELSYPLEMKVRLLGPTLIYLDNSGTPIQLELANETVQAILDDWNSDAESDRDPEESVTVLKPPKAT